MALASKHLAVSQPEHARATTPRGACIAAGGLDAETFRGFQPRGRAFSLDILFYRTESAHVGGETEKPWLEGAGESGCGEGAARPVPEFYPQCPEHIPELRQ
jgi:hypothetical protein